MEWTVERMTAFLKHCGINPDGAGEERRAWITRDELARIVADDVRENWPKIEAERKGA